MVVAVIEIVDGFIVTFLCSLDLARTDQNEGEAVQLSRQGEGSCSPMMNEW